MSDSSNDQGPGTTDGPGDQELDVIGASNVCQNPVEGTLYSYTKPNLHASQLRKQLNSNGPM